jgi:hypothetical protein
MSQGEMPVAGEPHHEAERSHEKGERVAKKEEIDDAAEKPEASEGEDGDADRS